MLLCKRETDIYRDMQTEDLNTTKENIQKTSFVPPWLVIWIGLSPVYAFVVFIPSVFGHFYYVCSNLANVCVFFCVFQLPICACSQWNQSMCIAFFLSFAPCLDSAGLNSVD